MLPAAGATRNAAAFAKVQGYLQAGDCYQVNLAQRFSAMATGDAFGAYLKLRNESRRLRRPMRDLADAVILSDELEKQRKPALG